MLLEAQASQKIQMDKINTVTSYFYFDERNKQLMETLYDSFDYLEKHFKQTLFSQGEKASTIYVVVSGLIRYSAEKMTHPPPKKGYFKDQTIRHMIFVPRNMKDKHKEERLLGVGCVLGLETYSNPHSHEHLFSFSATIQSNSAVLLAVKTEV